MILLVVSGAISLMFATSQPLADIELMAIENVLASEQELMLDMTVRANNPNVVVVTVDSADIEVFAKQVGAKKETNRKWLKSPWAFKQHGKSGAWVSDLFPNVAKCASVVGVKSR